MSEFQKAVFTFTAPPSAPEMAGPSNLQDNAKPPASKPAEKPTFRPTATPRPKKTVVRKHKWQTELAAEARRAIEGSSTKNTGNTATTSTRGNPPEQSVSATTPVKSTTSSASRSSGEEKRDAEFATLITQMLALESKCKDADVRIDELRREREDYIKKINNMQLGINQILNANKVLQEDVEKAAQEHEEKERRLTIKDLEVRRLHSEIKVKDEEAQNLRAVNKKIADDYYAIRSKNLEMEAQVAQNEKNAAVELENSILTADNIRLAEQLQLAQLALETMREEQEAFSRELHDLDMTAPIDEGRDLGEKLANDDDNVDGLGEIDRLLGIGGSESPNEEQQEAFLREPQDVDMTVSADEGCELGEELANNEVDADGLDEIGNFTLAIGGSELQNEEQEERKEPKDVPKLGFTVPMVVADIPPDGAEETKLGFTGSMMVVSIHPEAAEVVPPVVADIHPEGAKEPKLGVTWPMIIVDIPPAAAEVIPLPDTAVPPEAAEAVPLVVTEAAVEEGIQTSSFVFGLVLFCSLAAIMAAIALSLSSIRGKWVQANEETRLSLLAVKEYWAWARMAKMVFCAENFLAIDRALFG